MNQHLRIAPFAGIRYNPEKIPEITSVVAPPYDMISPQERELLYARHPHNVVRLILTRENEEDGFTNRYDRAASYYRNWRHAEILVRDDRPSIYAYQQDYSWDGKIYKRLGFIARVALTEFGKGAFPHESTLSGPKADRLKLLTACRANFSSIFSLFSDSDGSIQDRLHAETASSPLTAFEDERGVTHRMWRLSRPELHDWINTRMYEKRFIIADGHHRYETALEYRRLMKNGPRQAQGDIDYVMMFLAPIESKGLTVLPFHRLVTCAEPIKIPEKLAKAFSFQEHSIPEGEQNARKKILELLAREPEKRPAFVFYGGGETFTVLQMKEGFDAAPYLQPEASQQIARLDVTILHQVILRGLLNLDEAQLVQEGGITFHSHPEEIVAQVRRAGDKAGFFLRPTRTDQVWDIAVSGQKMPQKSTNFYPKLTTGLVINEF